MKGKLHEGVNCSVKLITRIMRNLNHKQYNLLKLLSQYQCKRNFNVETSYRNNKKKTTTSSALKLFTILENLLCYNLLHMQVSTEAPALSSFTLDLNLSLLRVLTTLTNGLLKPFTPWIDFTLSLRIHSKTWTWYKNTLKLLTKSPIQEFTQTFLTPNSNTDTW